MFVLSAFALNPWPKGERPPSTTEAESHALIATRLHQFFADEPACHVRIINRTHESTPERTASPCYTLAFAPWNDGPERFIKPTDWRPGPLSALDPSRESPNASPLFNVVCRTGPLGECDLWLRINHVGADGVPMQEMLSRLESSWGASYPVLFPTPHAFEPYAHAKPAPGREGLVELQFFADFAPLLAWRKRANTHLPEPMTVSAALLWQLGQLPEFRRFRLATTVDIAPADGMPRGVGVVVCHPAEHERRPQSERLNRFVRGFNRELDANRRRASMGSRMLDAAALLPAWLATPLLRFALTKASLAFGSVGLTMLKDAKVFATPIAEVGHNHGFMAVGSVSLPCTDGRPGGVACVTVKGSSDNVEAYPHLIEQAIAACNAQDDSR